mmetsp:Transcript_48983/g.137131  ORF Transcript_48983/g.137131 Transcript_48983/m.137131 type:complete len:89 (+) Transcript_48983:1231-1497(+)
MVQKALLLLQSWLRQEDRRKRMMAVKRCSDTAIVRKECGASTAMKRTRRPAAFRWTGRSSGRRAMTNSTIREVETEEMQANALGAMVQ